MSWRPAPRASVQNGKVPPSTTPASATNIEAGAPAQPPFVIDTKPLLQEVLDLIAAGADAGAIALTAHQRIAGTTVQAVLAVVRATGIGTVALSGGVFMNRLLLKAIRRDLEHAGLRVLVPHTVPVNDGCISYGQAAVARAQLAQRIHPRDKPPINHAVPNITAAAETRATRSGSAAAAGGPLHGVCLQGWRAVLSVRKMMRAAMHIPLPPAPR